MTKITVNDLPNEIIIKILKNLDSKHLPNASLACKRWRDLIEDSCLWSVVLRTFAQDDKVESWNDFMLKTNRKYQSISLMDIGPIDTNKLLGTFQRHGVNVVKLQLKRCKILDYGFAELLNCMPNLRHVRIAETVGNLCETLQPQEIELPHLNRLHTLEIVYGDCCIIKFFQNAKLSSATVGARYCQCFPIRSWNCSFFDFLKSQKALTSLSIEGLSHNMTEILRNQTSFQLRKLSLRDMAQNVPYSSLLYFLRSQAKSLKYLELGSNHLTFILPLVFAEMTNLETLDLKTCEEPHEKAFYDQLVKNQSITNFQCCYSGFTSEIFHKLPNLNSLNLTGYSGYPNLLAIQHVQIQNLKTLRIRRLYAKIDWNEFAKAYPRLTNLTVAAIGDKSYFQIDDIDHITTNVGLQYLSLGVGFVADERFFEIVRVNCPEMRVLELHRSCISDELKHNIDCDVLRLYE